MSDKKLTLIIPYRRRKEHLSVFLNWFTNKKYHDFEAIIIESDDEPYLQKELSDYFNINYLHCEESRNSVFHLSKYLNLGLANAKSGFICPFDIDLIPYNDALNRHYKIASTTPHIVSGYRLNVSIENWKNPSLGELEICSEDSHSALKKHLTTHEKFGVCPIFKKEYLEAISGWDEKFKGWGAEDQDITERYMTEAQSHFLRSPELVYLHIKHDYDEFWKTEGLVQENRAYYAMKNSSTDS